MMDSRDEWPAWWRPMLGRMIENVVTTTHEVYVGPIRELRGQRALVMRRPGEAWVRAQFDCVQLTFRGWMLGFNWHRFGGASFRPVPLETQ